MFDNLKLYRHDNCLDIDLFVIKKCSEDSNGCTLNVKYYNRHYKVFQGDEETVFIKKENYNDWHLIESSNET